MKKIKELWPKGLAGKLIRFVIIFMSFMGIVFMAISHIQLTLFRQAAKMEDERQTLIVQTEYRGSISSSTIKYLSQIATWSTERIDDEFWVLDHDIRTLQTQAEEVFLHPLNYERIPVLPPQMENKGKYALQILYPEGEENADPKSVEMMERLANLSPIMEEILSGHDGYTNDVCISTLDGVTIIMDTLSGEKINKDGQVISYDPRKRPWFTGAIEKGDVYFSPATNSELYDFYEVVIGIPIFVDGEIVAVIEEAVKIDVLLNELMEMKVGDNSFAVLVTDKGQLVCTPRDTGELAMREDPGEDIRNSVNEDLIIIINKALNEKKEEDSAGIGFVAVDSENYYTAYGVVETSGWVQIIFIPADEMTAPMLTMLKDMDESTDKMIEGLTRDSRRTAVLTVLIMLGFLAVAIVFIIHLAKKRVAPIQHMTQVVRGFVGDDMNFEMEDIYKTGDEIEELAKAFDVMSHKMKNYVNEIVEYTSDKERNETEMKDASQIQLQMLPKIEPHFCDKPEYELFAKMIPAKHVGGDMYDFFYLDEDHLVIMIGDVSGKGITAALFMALSKSMIKSQMLLHGGRVSEALTEANLRLCEESVDAMFVTVWLGVVTLSTGVMEFANGGHLYAAVRRDGGDFTFETDDHGMLLGGLDFANYPLNTTTLHKGDIIYLYTDGVTEAHDSADELFGGERLLKALNEAKDKSVEEIDDHVRSSVDAFVDGAEQYDDITTLCFKYLGKDSQIT